MDEGIASRASIGTEDEDPARGFTEVRVGIHVGEIDRRGDDVSGLAVHIAARAMSSADAGQILCTAVVAQLAGSGSFQRVGERSFKGVEGTWELYVPTSDHPALA